MVASHSAWMRLEIWSRAIYMLQDFPFTGIGMGAFRQVANLLYPFFLAGPDAERLVDEGLVPSADYIGHDLWLTRNHHGAGFWDRGYPKDLADRLTELSQSLGERSLMVDIPTGVVYYERG